MAKELEKTYNPAEIEKRTYERWLGKKYFHAQADHKKKPFTIVMPPPNITGQLHMGHALDNTLQDIFIRFKRMQGYEALWVPGTDHASIATEAKVVEKLREEGTSKEEIGREEFLKRVWEWKDQYGGRITEQLKKLGSSCDWDRERFTMDDGCNRAVREVFVRLYKKDLIYRGERIINWCPKCLTSISDAEVEYEDQAGSFWHLRYPLTDGTGFIELATTRPETLLGDTAVAVHPADERYRDMVGKEVNLPIVHRKIPIIADEYVDREFGTGAVKITPAHDPNDFEVGLRHHLEVINVMTPDACITDDYPQYAGMDRYEARKAIVKDLENEGALIKIEPHAHNVGTCYRCKTTVEPRVSKQWFVRMEELAKPAIEAVKTGETTFVPAHFDKTYFHWLENIKDWCISRQLWWGHRIPAFYCDDCGQLVVTKEESAVCPKCGRPMRQDPDTLDTWFSSALWPFSVLGWPEKTEEMDYFYPTDTLVTGYDIILFWVIRMMFSGVEHTGKAPFHTVFIHGLVRDSQGRKMSKSLGNGIDPLSVIDKYGADALRLTLVTGNAPGNDMRFYWERVEASRNFANKVWNASRFILMHLGEEEIKQPKKADLTVEDRWILSAANTLVTEVTENMEKYELGVAVAKITDFIRTEFCDWYIEFVKPRLAQSKKDPVSANAAFWTLKTVLVIALKLLHPYMPFITEEIFTTLEPKEESIMISPWPVNDGSYADDRAQKEVELIQQMVCGVRNVRAQMDVAPSRKAKVYLVTDDEDTGRELTELEPTYAHMIFASAIFVQKDKSGIEDHAVSVVTEKVTVVMPLADLVDIKKERDRLTKEKERLTAELARANGMLNNKNFVERAPRQKVEQEREKLEKYKKMMEKVEEELKALP